MWARVACIVAVLVLVVTADEEACSGDQAYRSTSRCICSPQVTIGGIPSSPNVSSNLLEVILAQVVAQNEQLKSQGEEVKQLRKKYSSLKGDFKSLNSDFHALKRTYFDQVPKVERSFEEVKEYLAKEKLHQYEKVWACDEQEKEKKREKEKKKEKKRDRKEREEKNKRDELKKEQKKQEKEEFRRERKEEPKKEVKETPLPKDCAEIQLRGNCKSGVYRIMPAGTKKPYDVFCDLKTEGGGWLVLQRRMDGRMRFNRSWASFKIGFGRLDLEFWLGNDKIHHLSHQRAQELRIDLRRFNGNTGHAKYANFRIANEDKKYRLFVGEYSGTVGDGLRHHNTKSFSTYDHDNDQHDSARCVELYGGGWWYGSCYDANLNGVYYRNARMMDGIVWYGWTKNHESLQHVEIKIRPTDFMARLGKN